MQVGLRTTGDRKTRARTAFTDMSATGFAPRRLATVPTWLVIVGAVLATFNCVLNNAYVDGSTLHDSTMYETMIWRSGFTLKMAPALGGESYYRTHISPLLLLPNALSYLWPWSRVTFYATVYALAWGWMAWVFVLVLRAAQWSEFAAAAGALAALCGQALFNGSWEPHMEVIAPAPALLALLAWQQRRYRWAVGWLLVVALIREDFALFFGAPMVLLGVAQWWELRRWAPDVAGERLRFALGAAAVALLYTVVAFAIQKRWFAGLSLLSDLYFDPAHPAAHLNAEMLWHRAREIALHRTGLWLPLVVLAGAAVWLRSLPLAVGAVVYVPLLSLLYLAKLDLKGEWGSYNGFPLLVSLFWPAIVVLAAPRMQGQLRAVQWLCLAASLSYLLMVPDVPGQMARQWSVRYLGVSPRVYEAFGAELRALQQSGEPLRVSHAVAARYPYDVPSWSRSTIVELPEAQWPGLRTMVWFADDRDQRRVNAVLASGRFEVREIAGTKLRIGRRVD